MGSYLCVIAARATPTWATRSPSVARSTPRGPARRPRGVPGDAAARVELGPDDVYVPPGWFWTGRANVPDVLPWRRLWCDGLVAKRFPLTDRDYLAWLDDLVAAGRVRRRPRRRWAPARSATTSCRSWGDPARGLALRDPSLGTHPASMVDWSSTVASCDALRDGTGLAWRLPGELEWEKARAAWTAVSSPGATASTRRGAA
jgi:eukaryotic-like serine/threonine-protein kinase